MSKKLTVEQVSDLLIKEGFIKEPFKRVREDGEINIVGNDNVCAEIYGRRAELYIYFDSMKERKEVQNFLSLEGIAFDPGYNREESGVAISVKYFKGHHWNQ